MTRFVETSREGQLLLIAIDRPEKHNAWNVEIIQAVAAAYSEISRDTALRAGVVYGRGEHFTAGLDLASVLPAIVQGGPASVLPEALCDPWAFGGRACTKPVVLAVHGLCHTLGIELILAAQGCVAASNTRFAQLEVARGVVPLGGATFRLPMRCGAAGMRWLLGAEEFDAHAALRAGLVDEVVEPGAEVERAIEIARVYARNSPSGVQVALAGFRAAERALRDAAADDLRRSFEALLAGPDAREGMAAMQERRSPDFGGSPLGSNAAHEGSKP